MSEPQLDRQVRRRLAVLRHVEEITGNVAMSSRLAIVWLTPCRPGSSTALRETIEVLSGRAAVSALAEASEPEG